MPSRRNSRIAAFQALYAWDAGAKAEEGDDDFARLLSAGAIENHVKIDKLIKKHLKNWEFKRISMVDRAILRMSVYSLMFQKDIPVSVVIDEAVEIAKIYGADNSFRFINGILDGAASEGAVRETDEKNPPAKNRR